jgi:hypothetical protein
MALLQCQDCNGQVSDAASACPHCGRPVTFETEVSAVPQAQTYAVKPIAPIPTNPPEPIPIGEEPPAPRANDSIVDKVEISKNSATETFFKMILRWWETLKNIPRTCLVFLCAFGGSYIFVMLTIYQLLRAIPWFQPRGIDEQGFSVNTDPDALNTLGDVVMGISIFALSIWATWRLISVKKKS